MAHNLEKRDTQWGVEQAWHGLTNVADRLTVELVYPYWVELQPVYYMNAAGEMVKLGNQVLPVATDDRLPLGFGQVINLDTYTPECPHENWAFLESVLDGTNYRVVSAGSVQNRSKYFVSAELTELNTIITRDGKEHRLNFNSKGSMDKSLRKQLSLSITTIVCYNTLMGDFLTEHTVGQLRKALDNPNLFPSLAEGQKVGWTYRHSKFMKDRVEADRLSMEEAAGFGAVVRETFNLMLSRPCDKDRAAAIYAGYISARQVGKKLTWPDELSTRAGNMVEEHVSCFARGAGNVGKTESDLLNGWTEPKTRGYSYIEDSKKSKFDVYASSEMGSYAAEKNEFAELLTFNREKLAEIEAAGRALIAKG